MDPGLRRGDGIKIIALCALLSILWLYLSALPCVCFRAMLVCTVGDEYETISGRVIISGNSDGGIGGDL